MRRLTSRLLWTLLVLSSLLALAWWATRPVDPDAFYTPPGVPPAQAGVLLRQEVYERQVPNGAQAWRLLYTTSDLHGRPVLASAIVMVSRQAPAGPRPVIAWAHGTTGVAAGCAPSLLAHPYAHLPALSELLAEGWILVATDYAGLGTPGPHPYLIGEGEARSVLDAVRAARRMQGLQADIRTVVWGHSQGGHAALWAGMLAPQYAPDVTIAGVAAVAPATDLPALVDRAQHGLVGRVMSAYILQAYSAAYPDVRFDDYTPGLRGLLAKDMARRCLEGPQTLFALAEAALSGGSIFATAPLEGALGQRLAQNIPARPLPAPLLIAQGEADALVWPDIQARYVQQRCRAGQPLEFRRYAGQDHLSIVAPDSPLTPQLVAWTRDRLAGRPASMGCQETRG